jgi:hypothetical protein
MGGYYTQNELRQAIFDAAGGNTAPNRNVLYNVADRIGRDYKEQLRKIDDAALDEADRIAFSGTETNLNQALNRGFMFTWWVGNASQLYLTEASRSPLQMYMWSRMLENADYNTKQGTDKRYRFYRNFMSTPAGYTLHLQVDDIEAWWKRAVDAGCVVTMPVEKMFWGDLYGHLRDPFGIGWSLGQAV